MIKYAFSIFSSSSPLLPFVLFQQPTDQQLIIKQTDTTFSPHGYEFWASHTCSGSDCAYTLDCTYNWWGIADEARVQLKVLDQSQDSRYLSVNHTQQLLTASFDCTSRNNCSGRGVCSRPDRCTCNSGWTGPNCTQYSCGDVYDCNSAQAAGNCTGPNVCSCNAQWSGSFCDNPICSGGCGHGVCALPNVCRCFLGWATPNNTNTPSPTTTLPDSLATSTTTTTSPSLNVAVPLANPCSECDARYAGPSCSILCPACARGYCSNGRNGTGQCVCDRGWTGTTCSSCARGYFGYYCDPFTALDNISPSSGQDVGGMAVNIAGFNFANSSSFRCQFGWSSTPVAAVRVNSELLRCIAPESPPDCSSPCTVQVYVLENTTQVGYGNGLYFTYLPVCPNSYCNNFGVCVRGVCSCLKGWTGDRCNVSVIPVSVSSLAAINMIEGRAYVSSTPLPAAGATPIVWSLQYSSPYANGLSLSINGLLSWDSPIASVTPYTLTLRASNSLNAVTATLVVNVPPSYRGTVRIAAVDTRTVNATEPRVVNANGVVTLRGAAQSDISGVVTSPVNLIVWVRRADGFETTASITTLPGGQFQYIYYTNEYASGRFYVGISHPADTNHSLSFSQDSFSTYAFSVQNSVFFGGLPGRSVAQVTLVNRGDLAVTGLSVAVPASIPLPAGLALSFSGPTTLPASGRAVFNVTVDVVGPYLNYW